MISQVRTATLAQAVLPSPRVSTFIGLILALGLLTAIFEAISPSSFDLLDPFSWGSFLKDASKDLGIVVSFGIALAYLGQLAKATAVEAHSRPVLQAVLSKAVKPAPWSVVLGDAVRIIAFSLLITLFARISIHFGDNPVPITGQTLAVLLTGAALGSRLGVLATLMYLAQGSAGLHVYAGGGYGLFWELASGGYLVGFVAAAFLVGFLVERGWDRGARLLLAMLMGNVMLYIPGLIQLALFVGWDKTLEFGLYPFIPGDLAKLYVASLLVPTAWTMLQLRQRKLATWR